MKNAITHLKIENFKSIKSMEMDCKRINIFLGKPNVGKSNILEAISLLGAEYSKATKFLSEFIRYEDFENLFYDNEVNNVVQVNSNIGNAVLRYHYNLELFDLAILPSNEDYHFLDLSKEGLPNTSMNARDLSFKERFQNIYQKSLDILPIRPSYHIINKEGNADLFNIEYFIPVRRYIFKKVREFEGRYNFFLKVPFGENLPAIVDTNKKLRDDITLFFQSFGLQILYNKKAKKFEVVKIVDGILYAIPYSLTAETLQRIIFHLAAIYSNIDSVLLFEEPEAHMFPPYILYLANEILESEDNQFFIATHSDHFLTEIIERGDLSEIALFKVYYEDYQTKIHPFSEEEIGMLLDGYDPFINHSAFGEDEKKDPE